MGQGAVFLCAVLWSTSGLFIKLIDWHPVVIAGMRSLAAFFFMLAIRLRPRKRGSLASRSPFKLRCLWGGGIAYSATMLLFCVANKLTSSANAILLQYSAPVWAALLGWVLAKEKPRTVHWISLAMVIGGLCLFFKDGLEGGSFAGNAIALLSGIAFGANSVFMRIQKQGESADSMLLAHFLTALASIPLLFFYPPAFNPGNTAAVLFMGIVQIGIASLLFAYGIRRIPAVQAMLTAVAEPILNPVWVLLVTGEKPAFAALLGGLVIVTAVIISSVGRFNSTGKRPAAPKDCPPREQPRVPYG
jgi:drug/metabolite transporter (DMT)-like permease